MKTIPFFMDSIEIDVHSATKAEHVGRKVTIREFAAGQAITLHALENGDLKVSKSGEFIEGAEV